MWNKSVKYVKGSKTDAAENMVFHKAQLNLKFRRAKNYHSLPFLKYYS